MSYERHGATGTRAYRAWQNMKTRCLNPKNKKYAAYGERGIKVCERWMTFANFLADMGQPPAGMTLERKDVNGDYCATNCIWADNATQRLNRRSSVVVKGVLMTKDDAAKMLGLKSGCAIIERLKRGWSMADALSTPNMGG